MAQNFKGFRSLLEVSEAPLHVTLLYAPNFECYIIRKRTNLELTSSPEVVHPLACTCNHSEQDSYNYM
jgi:hypothetical protein